MQTEWLQAGEAARRLGCTTQTIRNWTRAGRLPFHRTSTGAFLFDARDVEALREDGTGAAASWPAILVSAFAWNRLDTHDGHECGGWVIGRDLGDRLVVERVVEEEHAERTRRSIWLDTRHALMTERAQAPGVVVLGSWHGHPPEANELASGADFAAWASTARTLGRSPWLGVVTCEPVSPGQVELDTSWYLVRADGESHRVWSPLRI